MNCVRNEGNTMELQEQIRILARFIEEAEKIVFFGGAGVSTESGVQDFRSKDGLYNQHDIRFDAYRPEYLLSHSCLTEHPEVFYEFYRQKLNAEGIEPNPAHRFLAELEESGKDIAVVTQNIDGLHQKAGSRRVYEIHGSTQRNYCSRCKKTYPADWIFRSGEPVPRCKCGGMIRCDVTLYEETLPEEAVEGAIAALKSADLLIIGGTSLTVYPAASYINYFRGQRLAVINREALSLEQQADLQISAPIGEVFSKVRSEVKLPPIGAGDS